MQLVSTTKINKLLNPVNCCNINTTKLHLEWYITLQLNLYKVFPDFFYVQGFQLSEL